MPHENINIKDIYENYLRAMLQVQSYQRDIDRSTKSEVGQLQQKLDSLSTHDAEKINSVSNFFFKKPGDGRTVFYGSRKSSANDRIKASIKRKNKHYQWLLAEAYEEFEDFLENIYAYLAFHDHDAWPLSDYGNIHLSELKSKSFEWLQNQASKKKSGPEILNYLRTKFPQMAYIEKNNKITDDLRFTLATIEMFRHIIVHNGGKIKDKEAFTNNIFKKVGEATPRKAEDERLEYLNSFIGNHQSGNTIVLLEAHIKTEGLITTYADRIGHLFDSMHAYAYFVSSILGVTYESDVIDISKPE